MEKPRSTERSVSYTHLLLAEAGKQRLLSKGGELFIVEHGGIAGIPNVVIACAGTRGDAGGDFSDQRFDAFAHGGIEGAYRAGERHLIRQDVISRARICLADGNDHRVGRRNASCGDGLQRKDQLCRGDDCINALFGEGAVRALALYGCLLYTSRCV